LQKAAGNVTETLLRRDALMFAGADAARARRQNPEVFASSKLDTYLRALVK